MSVLGIHYVGQMQEGSLMRFLVDQLTDGQLEWAQLPDIYDAVVLGDPQGAGKTYHIHSGKREYFRRLKEQFPGEEAAIDEFQRLVKVEADLGGIKRGEFGSGESHTKRGTPLAPGSRVLPGITVSPQNHPFLPQKCSITDVLGEISLRKKFFKELGRSF